MADKLILLDLKDSMFGMRARVALGVKGIEYESKEEDLNNKSQLLLEMNPVHKKIPVLIHNGKPVCESLVIVEYIDEVWKDKFPLLPSDPYQRARARFWTDYIDKKVYDTGMKIIFSKGEEQEAAKKALVEIFKELEGELGDKPFFNGDNFGFLDVALVSFYNWFPSFEIFGNFKLEGHVPKLLAWGKRCLEIENVSKSLCDADEVYNCVVQWKKDLGVE